MARYIDADILVERLKFKRDETDKVKKKYSGLECAISQVQKQPTADVVEVVRCKDCKHFNIGVLGFNWCDVHSYDELIERKENDFCNYGERRCEE